MELFSPEINQALEEKEKKQCMIKDNLHREQRYLKRRLETLRSAGRYRNSRAERTISECSSSTQSNVSTSSVSTEEQGIYLLMNFIAHYQGWF